MYLLTTLAEDKLIEIDILKLHLIVLLVSIDLRAGPHVVRWKSNTYIEKSV